MYASKIVASDNNIPTTYGTGAGSLLVSSLPSSRQIEIINTCESVLVVSVGPPSDDQVPNSVITTNRKQLYIPAAPTGSSAGWVKDFFSIRLGDRIYVRSDTGSAVTSGTVYINLW